MNDLPLNRNSTLDQAIAAYQSAGWVLTLRLGARALMTSPYGPECVYLEGGPDGALLRQAERDPDFPAPARDVDE